MPEIRIEQLELKGFRAYLEPQTLEFQRDKQPISVAVFAPNAKGKSSIVDAIEFFLSENATLERLGIRAKDTNAGRKALEHVAASSRGIESSIYIGFQQNGEVFGDTREVASQGTTRPPAAERVVKERTLDFIIRGYQLRQFVEQQSAQDRYAEIVSWFSLEPLLEIQNSLRKLRRLVKQTTNSDARQQERLRDLRRITSGDVTKWDQAAVLQWLNENVLAKLDPEFQLTELSQANEQYSNLERRKEQEDARLGLASLKQILNQATSLYRRSDKGEDTEAIGKIPDFERAVTRYNNAAKREAEERARVETSVFQQVWKAGKALLDQEDNAKDSCPLCETPWANSWHGSREAVKARLSVRLDELQGYRKAEEELRKAASALDKAKGDLVQALQTFRDVIDDTPYASRVTELTHYNDTMEKWTKGSTVPDANPITQQIGTLQGMVTDEKDKIESEQGEHTYAKALTTVNQLIELRDSLNRIERTKTELSSLHEELKRQAHEIDSEIANHIARVIASLRESVNELYMAIQGKDEEVPSIRLQLPSEGDTNQQRIQLLIDFAENRRGVPPSGYLSDSQIHSLALAIRLAAILLLNRATPILVLDDVVTSYDADHRKNIAKTIHKYFSHFQILLVTHDERFFEILQDHLDPRSWRFRRITDIKADFGPEFHDHRTPFEEISARLGRGERAGNEIRQAEEEWLLDVCRQFKVKVIIRPIDKPYKYDRGELATALASFLKKAGLTPPKVSGISNPFLSSLQKGDIENFSSHFSESPHSWGSVGDEMARWEEFLEFREYFKCPKCGGRKFKRPNGMKRPVCKRESCETPFAFPEPKDDD